MILQMNGSTDLVLQDSPGPRTTPSSSVCGLPTPAPSMLRRAGIALTRQGNSKSHTKLTWQSAPPVMFLIWFVLQDMPFPD